MCHHTNRQLIVKLALCLALLSVIFYFLHVYLGSINYPGYDSLRQAVSDLTAHYSPAKEIARIFSNLYGLFSSLFAFFLMFLFKKDNNLGLKVAIYMISIMYIISAVGYSFFPLSNDVFQNMMHVIVTICVVFLTILGMILLMIAYRKMTEKFYFYFTLISFLILLLGAILTNIVSENYFGLVERLSVYTVVIYLLFLGYFSYQYQIKKIEEIDSHQS